MKWTGEWGSNWIEVQTKYENLSLRFAENDPNSCMGEILLNFA
jgi:hypothetical protein